MSYIFRDADAVKAQVRHFIAAHPEITEDAEFLADVLEGETDLHKVIEKALTERQEALMMATAIKARMSDLSERMKRYEAKADTMKGLARDLMLASGLDKLPLPEATLTITKPRLSVEVLDVNDLPQGFFATERKADKKAIMEAFEAGMKVPGADVVKSDFGLTVRVK